MIAHGDALEVLRLVPDNSIDSIVTDPPAGISFMGRAWDGDKGGRKQWTAWLAGVMAECLRVLKPGGHALVWAIPRTSHWTATAIEDAGFEIRDVVVHLFGSGFPKSLNVSKAIDAADGLKGEREVVSTYTAGGNAGVSTADKGGTYGVGVGTAPAVELSITRGASERSRAWDGFGTALKPAAEHWILARKPMGQTVAANVLEYGTGALNIDGCRIGTEDDRSRQNSGAEGNGNVYGASETYTNESHALGRWPANVTLDEEAAAMLDEQSGDRPGMSGGGKHKGPGGMFGAIDGNATHIRADSGGASRFFYVAKPSTREREAGTEGLPRKAAAELTERTEDSDGLNSPRAGAGRTSSGRANHHPTVKSIALMRWLVRLVTPPGGLVLDPFCGSGTTGCAAVLEGMSFIGIEQDIEYVAIAEARIVHWRA